MQDNMPQEHHYTPLEQWLLSANGKRTLNRLYSWGAAFVIMGALFKFLEWPYANLILFLSLSTEILVFFISGFEPQSVPPSSETKDREAMPTSAMIQSSEAYREEMQRLAKSVAELQREHEQMLHNLAELNRVYKGMLEAMGKQNPRGEND